MIHIDYKLFTFLEQLNRTFPTVYFRGAIFSFERGLQKDSK